MTSLLLALCCTSPGVSDPPALPAPTPIWDELLKQRGLCAGPAVQAFQKLPRVCSVKPCDCEGDKGQELTGATVWVKEFHQAARVNYPRFGLDGCPLEGSGLLIYEGMRLRVDPDTGLYDLSFTATVPDMPVTLRLQLTFIEDAGRGPRKYHLTMPPIRMDPTREARPGDLSANTFHIAHRGHSTLFQTGRTGGLKANPPNTKGEMCDTGTRIDCSWELKRDGSARFGTAVTQDDPGR